MVMSTLTWTLISFVCYAFVDDTAIIQTTQHLEDPGEMVLPAMQIVVDRWEGGL